LSLVDGRVQVTFDGSVDGSFPLNSLTTIEVLLLNGDDTFRVDPATVMFGVQEITINGGRGNDDLHGGADAERFIGGAGRDTVDGNQGNDIAELGAGQDTFRWDPGDGSDMIDGDGGTDTLDFRGAAVAEQMALSPNGRRSQFTRVQGNITMDMNRVERLDLTALGGTDTITINDMSRTGFREANVNLGGADGAVDSLTVNGSNRPDDIEVIAQGNRVDVEGLRPTTLLTGTEPGAGGDQLVVNGLGGNDDIQVDPAVSNLVNVTVGPNGTQP
jgi:Ca2+-binding RTX toxin-like protein